MYLSQMRFCIQAFCLISVTYHASWWRGVFCSQVNFRMKICLALTFSKLLPCWLQPGCCRHRFKMIVLLSPCKRFHWTILLKVCNSIMQTYLNQRNIFTMSNSTHCQWSCHIISYHSLFWLELRCLSVSWHNGGVFCFCFEPYCQLWHLG